MLFHTPLKAFSAVAFSDNHFSLDLVISPHLVPPLPPLLSGQSYEVRMLDNRKPGELPELNNKMVKVRQLEVTGTPALILTFCRQTRIHTDVCVSAEHSQGGVP